MKRHHQNLLVLFLSLFVFQSITPSSSQSSGCAQTSFSNNRIYSLCNTLPHLGASLHWTYHPSNATADIAFRCPQSSSGWVAWALNPSSSGMQGAEALIAFPKASSSALLTVFTTKLDSYTPAIKNESLSFPVFRREAEYGTGMMTIYASIQLPKNRTKVNQVWQAGTVFDSNGVPAGHATSGDNTLSAGSLDLLSGDAAAAVGTSRQRRRN